MKMRVCSRKLVKGLAALLSYLWAEEHEEGWAKPGRATGPEAPCGLQGGTHIQPSSLWGSSPGPAPSRGFTPIPPGLAHQFKNVSPCLERRSGRPAMLLLANSAAYSWVRAADGTPRICPQMKFLVS